MSPLYDEEEAKVKPENRRPSQFGSAACRGSTKASVSASQQLASTQASVAPVGSNGEFQGGGLVDIEKPEKA
jgi:hypothetical protein